MGSAGAARATLHLLENNESTTSCIHIANSLVEDKYTRVQAQLTYINPVYYTRLMSGTLF